MFLAEEAQNPLLQLLTVSCISSNFFSVFEHIIYPYMETEYLRRLVLYLSFGSKHTLRTSFFWRGRLHLVYSSLLQCGTCYNFWITTASQDYDHISFLLGLINKETPLLRQPKKTGNVSAFCKLSLSLSKY